MSKTTISFSSHAFYGYPKPKRTCLHIRPIFSNLKHNLTELNKSLSSPESSPTAINTTTTTAQPVSAPTTPSAKQPRATTSLVASTPTPKKATSIAAIVKTKAIEIGNQHVVSPSTTIKSHKSYEAPKLASIINNSSNNKNNTSTTNDANQSDQSSIDTGYLSDRDSPLPLKNLGNTCYENSIIQCLFSLMSFMDDFVQTMDKVPDYIKDEDKDGKYTIADAFLRLYLCYTKERCRSLTITSKPDDSGVHTGSSERSTPSPRKYLFNDELISSFDQDSRDDDATANSLSNLSVSSQEKPSSKSTDDELQMDTADDKQQHSSLSPIALTSLSPSGSTEIEDRLNDLKSAVGRTSSQFNSTLQQDASEFFYLVIDSIQEFFQSLKQIKDEQNPVTKTFELELDYFVKCLKCHKKTLSASEKIRTLPLAIPPSDSCTEECSSTLWNGSNSKNDQNDDDLSSVSCSSNEEKENCTDSLDRKDSNASDKDAPPLTLHQALLNYFRDDLMEFSCSEKGCDSKEKTRKCLIRKLPQVLFLTLARYSHTGQKNLDEIEAPFEMSVPYKENKSPSQSPSAHRAITEDDSKYQLVAFVCHLGSSLNAGHYTSYVLNQTNGFWYSCDDDAITRVEIDKVEREAKRTGYCFFYAHNSTLELPFHRSGSITCKTRTNEYFNSNQPELMTSESKFNTKATKAEYLPLFSSSKMRMSSFSERVGVEKINSDEEEQRSKESIVIPSLEF